MSKILDEYVRQEQAIKGYLKRRFRGPGDVDDMAQEVFVRAFMLERDQEIKQPRALLFRIAHNLGVSEMRSAVVRRTILSDEPNAAENIDNRPSAEDEVDSRRKFGVFMRAVAALPPQTRKVFILRRVDGLSQREVAVKLEISESAVEKHVALGLARCAAFLQERGYAVNDRIRRQGEIAVMRVPQRAAERPGGGSRDE